MPKKQTLEEFIKKSNIAHNFKYNYDKSIYINKQTKVIVICPEMENPMREGEAVELTVEAVNARGGRRMFTSRDYPEFTVASPAAVEFFKFFTTNQ